MRFMILVKATSDSEAGVLPTQAELTAMGRYNEELVKAGVLLAGEGLHPTSRGVRVRFDGRSRTVIDGPFAQTTELLAGFWLIQVKSREEALEWARRFPNPFGETAKAEIEVRELYELEDFGSEDAERFREVGVGGR